MAQELITEIFEIVLIPLLTILTSFFVKWINSKTEEVTSNIEDETTKKYIEMLDQTITECVTATNQTYVNSLKAQGSFDTEAQKAAFQQTYQAVMTILSQEAQSYLSSAVGDLETYINQKIESQVNQLKVS